MYNREKDIDDFIPEEYWNITAHFKEKKKFPANLIKYNNRKIDIKCKAEADEVLSELGKGQFTVDKIEEYAKKEKLVGLTPEPQDGNSGRNKVKIDRLVKLCQTNKDNKQILFRDVN